jgi:catechol 2,3-dioxygenase-like lactoylglutathione lyase family enzyme
MQGVTPVGIISQKPLESREFYRQVLGIERVMTLRRLAEEGMNGTVLRLESPQIEILATEFRLLDRVVNQPLPRDHRIILRPRDMGALVQRLRQAGIEPVTNPSGGMLFEDLNGISWEIRFDAQAWTATMAA